jgi:steroid delta-isomerase-like uncharacterized protein
MPTLSKWIETFLCSPWASLALTGGMFAGCAPDQTDLPKGDPLTMSTPETAVMPSSEIEERNKRTARRWSEELWGAGKLPVADEIIAPDYVRHDAGDPFPARGPGDVKRIVAMLRGMLPDLRIEIEDMVAAGDRVVTRYVGVATDTRGYLGLPATGKEIRTPAIQIFRFEGGLIVESWAVRDDFGTLVQLGHLPRPGTPALTSCLKACAATAP